MLSMIEHFYIFSYNRWQFLDNLICSIERNFLSHNITIVDDCSDDTETLDYLERTTHRVVVPHAKQEKTSKYGNLYKNKNWALNEAKDKNLKHVVLMPEDAQCVRPFSSKENRDLLALFDSTENVFQCLPGFLEKVYGYTDIREHLCLLENCDHFIKSTSTPFKRLNFTDFGIIDVDRFFSLMGSYLPSESENEHYCVKNNIVCAYPSYPTFAMLPFNRYHRISGNRKLTELINRISETGFYPYTDMQSHDISCLFDKHAGELAFAEDWLNCPGVPNTDLWSFWGGFFNLEVYDDERRTLAHRLQSIKASGLKQTIKHQLMIEECEKYLENKHDTPHSKNTFYSYH